MANKVKINIQGIVKYLDSAFRHTIAEVVEATAPDAKFKDDSLLLLFRERMKRHFSSMEEVPAELVEGEK